MRLRLFLAITLASLCASCLAGISAPVTSVVLYPGSATVVRSAQVATGATEVVVEGLPANFNAETLRVQGTSGMRIGEVTTRDASGSDAFNPAEAGLAARIQALKDQQGELDAEAKSAAIVKSYLERYNGGAASGDKPGAGADAKSLSGVIGTLGRGASEALLKMQKIAVQKREVGKKIDVLERDLERLRSGARDTRAVTVRLAGGTGGTLTLSYQLDNASWKPGYRAGLDSVASTVDLERLATIAQNTGEDWSNVKMTLSTSRPSLSPVGIEPQPWLLSWHEPRPQPMPEVMHSYAPAPVMEAAAQKGALSRPALDMAPVETQFTFATEFEVPGRVSVASDGREVTVSLSSQKLAARQQLRVTPRLERFAIVMADTARPDGVWPAGNIQLFRDGNYIGATHWDLQDAERAQFAFGRDDLLKVSVDAVDGMQGSKGLFGDRASRNTADVFTLINRHKTAMDVIVFESSPVSTSEEIKVQAKFAPKPATEVWEQRRGVVAWKKKLAAGETAKFNVEYRIDYPKDGVMAGLR